MEALKHCCPICLRRLQETLAIDFPSDHGLHKALDRNVLTKVFGGRLTSQFFCMFMLLKQDLPLAHEVARVGYSRISPDLPDWVKQGSYDSYFFSFLAASHPWVEDELTLILRSLLLNQDLLKISTVAPEQLLDQWFLTTFRIAMDLLDAEHLEHPETPLQPFHTLLKFGQDLLAGRTKIQVPFGIPMPEELKPFCSSQSLVRLTVGQPTAE
jgi:hypothetical protein